MERHRHSSFFGKQLVLVISGEPSKFPSVETAENYFRQTIDAFSTEGEVGGRGYAGEVLCALLSCFPDATLSLTEIASCQTLSELTELLTSTIT